MIKEIDTMSNTMTKVRKQVKTKSTSKMDHFQKETILTERKQVDGSLSMLMETKKKENIKMGKRLEFGRLLT